MDVVGFGTSGVVLVFGAIAQPFCAESNGPKGEEYMKKKQKSWDFGKWHKWSRKKNKFTNGVHNIPQGCI